MKASSNCAGAVAWSPAVVLPNHWRGIWWAPLAAQFCPTPVACFVVLLTDHTPDTHHQFEYILLAPEADGRRYNLTMVVMTPGRKGQKGDTTLHQR